MDYALDKIFDIPSLQRLMDKFYDASKIPFALIDLKGNILVGAGWQAICVNFHRANSKTAKKCIKSDTAINSRLKSGDKYVVYTCPMGLVDCASPLIIENKHIANLFTGQFFLEEPDPQIFRENAKKYGFDEDKYIEAMKRVPVFKESDVISFLEFYQEFSTDLAKIGINQLENKKIESERIKAQKLESLAILSGGIAHDYNNLLVGILGNVSFLRKFKTFDTETRKILEQIETASLRARDLTNQLVTFSKGGAPIRKPKSITSVLDESVELMTHGSNSKCETHYNENLPLVFIDESQISQVFNNFIINSLQAMPDGGNLDIYVDNVDDEEISSELNIDTNSAQKYVKIMIKDTGCGIDEENFKNIFQPYYTSKPKGTGLGLATSYSIIKRHGGYITFSSKKNKGTTFNIFLPTTDIIEEESELIDNFDDLKFKAKILIMDDNKLIRETMKMMLEDMGLDVEEATDGDIAIEMYKKSLSNEEPYSLVIMDLTIPGGKGGLETLKILKELDPNVKTVVSSGYSKDEVLSNYKEIGFNAILPKPYQFSDIQKLLFRLLKDKADLKKFLVKD